MSNINGEGKGYEFRIYPPVKKDGFLSIKLWAKNQAILLLAMVPIGGGLIFFGAGGMLVFFLLIVTMPVSLFIAARQLTPALERASEKLPRATFNGKSLTLPLYGGETAEIQKGEGLEIRPVRFSSSTGAPNSAIRVYGVVVDFIIGEDTYRIWGQGVSPEAEKEGFPVDSYPSLSDDFTVRMPISVILEIYRLMS